MSDYNEPLLRASRYNASVVGGACALRLRRRDGQYHLNEFSVVVTNTGVTPTSIVFKEVDDYRTEAPRTSIGSQLDLCAGAFVQLNVSNSKRFLEVWGVNSSSEIRLDIKSKIRWDVVPFNRFDQTDSNLMWRPAQADEPVGIQYSLDPIVVYAGSAFSFEFDKGAFIDFSGRGLSIEVTAPGWDVNGLTVSGTPTSDKAGTYRITAVATDYKGRTATAVQDLVVVYVNVPPVVVNEIGDMEAQVSSPFSINIDFGNVFSDDPIDTLAYSIEGLPSWAELSGSTIYGIPSLSDVDSIGTVVVTATDNGGLSTSTKFSITVVNNPPQLGTPIPAQTAALGVYFDFTIPSSAVTDTDTLTYSLSTALPDWLEFNSVARRFTGTPDLTDLGTVHVTVSASDTLEQSVDLSFDINVVE